MCQGEKGKPVLNHDILRLMLTWLLKGFWRAIDLTIACWYRLKFKAGRY